jgi:hypothetical protein
MTDVVRTETHLIDTAARKIVPTLVPATWEHREVAGRDYGIDLQLERFESGKATGNILLLQIKGTSKELNEENLHFDLPVKTLKYSEMFVVPFLLVVCPINSTPHRAYFCWLQEYIKVVLDFDNPTWRDNIATARIKLHPELQIPKAVGVIEWISQEPQRLRDWLKVASLQHKFKDLIPRLQIHHDQRPCDGDIARGKKFVGQLKSLKTLALHPTGFWLAHYINILDKSFDLIKRDGPYNLKDVEFLGAIQKLPPEIEEFVTEDQTARALLSLNLQTVTDGLMTTLTQYFDDELKRSGLMASEAYLDPIGALKKLAEPKRESMAD